MSVAFCAAWINEVTLVLPPDWTRDVPAEMAEGATIYLSTCWTSPHSKVTLTATVSSTGQSSADICCSGWSVEAENLSPAALAAAINAATTYGAQPDAPDLSSAFVGVSLAYHDWQSASYANEPVQMRRWISPDGNRVFDFIRRNKSGTSVFVVHRVNPGHPAVEAAITADGFTPAAVLLSLAMSD
ncbi:hypothetical protein Caci_8583 [Catenulispora acidiphila DSM 44928]|uniref:Uncharacterized protein n=1 Tax=Catenulispora acidiphila (strain DSM 44928 / JCM 14897 / NBRC 102108 / NRRL B-24433 / ID139908) TaxID=479433 RepID=C7PYT0_CATAD|nr:hypothetical protein [Catenulispora acidiphila]ACU77402.1 hypothetical protein Caci_8583 [Catenulispora acidiphila DSM 44928]